MIMKAKYTTFLKDILENEKTKPLLAKALSSYPLYKQKSSEKWIPVYIPTREELNRKIINAYKYREIGFESVGRFLEELEITMNEIMPRYNLLYFTTDQDFNPIYNVDYTRETETKRTGSTSSKSKDVNETVSTNESSTGSNTNASDHNHTESSIDNADKSVSSDTPQSSLTVPAQDIDEVTYANNVTWNKGNNKSDSDSDSNTESSTTTIAEGASTINAESNIASSGESKDDEKIKETIFGNYGQVSSTDLLDKFRSTAIDVTNMILNDQRLKELFMLVY